MPAGLQQKKEIMASLQLTLIDLINHSRLVSESKNKLFQITIRSVSVCVISDVLYQCGKYHLI